MISFYFEIFSTTNLWCNTSLSHRALSVKSCIQRKSNKQWRRRIGRKLWKILKQNKKNKLICSVHNKLLSPSKQLFCSCTSLIIVLRVFSNHLISNDRHIRSLITRVTSCCHRDTTYSSSACISSEQFFNP